MKKLFENWRKFNTLNEATFASAKDMIETQKIPFFIVSAARSERGTKYSRGNISAAQDLKSFFKRKGLSYTIVDGGYTEMTRDEDGEETGETLDVQEESYLVFGDVPHYGDEDSRIKDIQALFEIAKEACLIDAENPQESFSFGYPRKIDDPVEGGLKDQIFIALYKNDAPAPGLSNAFTDWGGPWTSFKQFMAAEGAYTKVRGTKGTFAESMLKEARGMKVTSVISGYKKQAKIRYWNGLNKRWKAENRRTNEADK